MKTYTLQDGTEITPFLPPLEGEVEAIDTGDDCRRLVRRGVSAQEFSDYLNALESWGYQPYASAVIDQNAYFTYKNGEFVVTAMLIGENATARILIQPLSRTALMSPEQREGEACCEPLLTQLGLYYDFEGYKKEICYLNGMCDLIRCPDGSFLVIDGGHFKEIDADRLYQVMKKQAPDPQHITVSSWFLTHADGDHVGTLVTFCKKYSDKVTVRQFVFNFGSQFQIGAYPDCRGQVEQALAQSAYRDVPRVKAHAGQTSCIGGVAVQILYSADLLDEFPLKDFNDTSLVISAEVGGRKILFLGDYSEYGKTLMELYSDRTLKSDIVQVAHHGIAGQGPELYRRISAEYALIPVGDLLVEFDAVNGKHYRIEVDKLAINEPIMQLPPQNILTARDDVAVIRLDAQSMTVRSYDNDKEYLEAQEKS